MGSSDEIIALAKRSGLPYQVGSTYRPGAVTLSGRTSYHASDDAVDFSGYNQDALAKYFMGLPTLEVIHHSNRTGVNYATSSGNPFTLQGALLAQHRDHLHVAGRESALRPVLGSGGGRVFDPAGDPIGTARSLLDAIPVPSTVTGALTNIGTALRSTAATAAEVGVLAQTVTRAFLPSNLIRAAFLVSGSIFVLIGIWFLAREVRDS